MLWPGGKRTQNEKFSNLLDINKNSYLKLFKNLDRMEKINCIYQGCFTKNEDGTNRIIANNKACLFPTDKQFGKYPEDVPSEVKTRSQCKKKKKN